MAHLMWWWFGFYDSHIVWQWFKRQVCPWSKMLHVVIFIRVRDAIFLQFLLPFGFTFISEEGEETGYLHYSSLWGLDKIPNLHNYNNQTPTIHNTFICLPCDDRLGEERLQKDCWLLATHLDNHTKQITGTSGFKLFTMIHNITSKHSVECQK